jgi:hypothetical protein
MLNKQQNIKRTHKYRNKLTNTKIIVDSDEEQSDNEINNINDTDDTDDTDDMDDNISKLEDEELDEDSDNEEQIKLNEKFSNYKSDIISKYIVPNKITDYNSKAIMCYYLWSGADELDRWELNRKINLEQVKKIYKEMTIHYQKLNEFIFYEPVHIAIKKNSVFYVIDGQHRLLACAKLYKKNKYPIQQIPCVLWFPKTEEEFIEIFDKINSRTPMDKTKLFNYKINELIEWFDKTWGKKYSIWGKTRPKINKDLMVEKMRESDSIHKLETNEILERIKKINEKIRGFGRNKRCLKPTSDSVHNNAETMNFFLGYDKELGWIEDIY